MKKILIVLFVGVAVIGIVALSSGAAKTLTPEGKMCVKLGDLCGAEAKADKFEQCVDQMKKVRKVAGDPAFERSQKCLEESNSCGAATGCMAGGIGVGALGEMMKGFGSALQK